MMCHGRIAVCQRRRPCTWWSWRSTWILWRSCLLFTKIFWSWVIPRILSHGGTLVYSMFGDIFLGYIGYILLHSPYIGLIYGRYLPSIGSCNGQWRKECPLPVPKMMAIEVPSSQLAIEGKLVWGWIGSVVNPKKKVRSSNKTDFDFVPWKTL